MSVCLSISIITGRPKWIPLYNRRTLIDGRSHKSTWSSIFDDAVDDSTVVVDAVDQDTFIDRIQALAYRPCLGTHTYIRTKMMMLMMIELLNPHLLLLFVHHHH